MTFITDNDIATGTYLTGSATQGSGVFLSSSNIIVKYGHRVRASEAEAMKYIRKQCPDIPIPELHSFWLGTDGRGYIAMAPLAGTSLHTVWKSMALDAKQSVVADYRTVVSLLRSLPPPPGTQIGAIDGGPVIDHRGSGTAFGNPCNSEADFNNFLLSKLDPHTSDVQRETVTACLKCNHDLRFTHGDLGPHNILVQNGRITGVIDWEFAGWYPEYWEYLKMGLFTADSELLWHARRFWGEGIFYDQEILIDSMLDRYILHGERVLKRVRFF